VRELFLTLSLLVSVVLLVEFLLHLTDPIGVGYFKAVNDYVESLEPGGSWSYLHKPGYRARLQGVDFVINQYGLRSPPTTIEKPRGTTRVLVLGDSVVLGWGVAQDSIFPARLDRALDAPDAPVEVIAAGVVSWNTRTEYEWLHARGFAFDPDVVVLLIVGNDVEPKGAGRTDVPMLTLVAPDRAASNLAQRTWRVAYAHSYLLGWVQYLRVSARKQRTEFANAFPLDSPRWRDARLALDGMIDECRARGVDLVVFLYGDPGTVERSGVGRAYRDHLAARGVPTGMFPSFLFEGRRYRNSRVDAHENSPGHAILAREIGAVVDPRLAEERSKSQ
jgi:lysophospholipase L1-like esterase